MPANQGQCFKSGSQRRIITGFKTKNNNAILSFDKRFSRSLDLVNLDSGNFGHIDRAIILQCVL